jgi:hypothetical protein
LHGLEIQWAQSASALSSHHGWPGQQQVVQGSSPTKDDRSTGSHDDDPSALAGQCGNVHASAVAGGEIDRSTSTCLLAHSRTYSNWIAAAMMMVDEAVRKEPWIRQPAVPLAGVVRCCSVGMKTDRIRTDITDIVFVFIFMSGFGFEYG